MSVLSIAMLIASVLFLYFVFILHSRGVYVILFNNIIILVFYNMQLPFVVFC